MSHQRQLKPNKAHIKKRPDEQTMATFKRWWFVCLFVLNAMATSQWVLRGWCSAPPVSGGGSSPRHVTHYKNVKRSLPSRSAEMTNFLLSAGRSLNAPSVLGPVQTDLNHIKALPVCTYLHKNTGHKQLLTSL